MPPALFPPTRTILSSGSTSIWAVRWMISRPIFVSHKCRWDSDKSKHCGNDKGNTIPGRGTELPGDLSPPPRNVPKRFSGTLSSSSRAIEVKASPGVDVELLASPATTDEVPDTAIPVKSSASPNTLRPSPKLPATSISAEPQTLPESPDLSRLLRNTPKLVPNTSTPPVKPQTPNTSKPIRSPTLLTTSRVTGSETSPELPKNAGFHYGAPFHMSSKRSFYSPYFELHCMPHCIISVRAHRARHLLVSHTSHLRTFSISYPINPWTCYNPPPNYKVLANRSTR